MTYHTSLRQQQTGQPPAIPHPFPYQGSKRALAKHILPHFPHDVERLIEPFCGSAAISIAAASYNLAQQFHLNDLNQPLMHLWAEIINRPNQLADQYEALWHEQHPHRKAYFFRIRAEFNQTHQPHHLLYLLARIVKGAVRYSSDGNFNQSADNRRSGMKPDTMRQNLLGVSHLLAPHTTLSTTDFYQVASQAEAQDLVYMDPPYQGTSFTRDQRYTNGLLYEAFVDALHNLNEKNISYIVSYDGLTGNKKHGKPLPASLSLKHLYIHAGRSSQATLLGTDDQTIESLYLSPALVARLNQQKCETTRPNKQLEFTFA